MCNLKTAAPASACVLAACGGGGESVTVFADGSPIDGVDLVSYQGRTFPTKVAFGVLSDGAARVGYV